MARREPQPRDTKERVLAAALDVFGEQGYAPASVEEIAARAGLTKGAVYYYFADKEDLARDLQHDLWERFATAALAVVDPDGETVENLGRGFDAFVATLQAEPAARFFLRDIWAGPALDEAGRPDRADATGLLRGLLEAGMERGDVAPVDPDALAHVLMGAFMEGTLHILTTGDAGATRDVIGRLLGALAVVRTHRKGKR